jgi:hypothetical protein
MEHVWERMDLEGTLVRKRALGDPDVDERIRL